MSKYAERGNAFFCWLSSSGLISWTNQAKLAKKNKKQL